MRTNPEEARGAEKAVPEARFEAAAARLVGLGRELHARGWVLGTSGNFSEVVSRRPLRLAITPSGAHKGALEPERILEVAGDGTVSRGEGLPSSETAVHLAVVRSLEAGAVVHTHSVWATLLSERHADAGGIRVTGFEMLKGLDGVDDPDHVEWIPVLDNDQDRDALADRVSTLLTETPDVHGLLLRHHGLYTWGADLGAARRHLEVLEFLLEVVGRGGGSS